MRVGTTAGAALAALGCGVFLVTPAGGQTAPTPDSTATPAPTPAPTSTSTSTAAPSPASTETPAPASTDAPPPAPPAPTSTEAPPPAPTTPPAPTSTEAPTPKPPVDANAALATGVAGTDMARFRYANTWNLDIEGGGGYVFGGVDKWTGFVRARPGVLLVRNDNFYQLGATAEYMGLLRRPAFGLQAEYLHLQLGTWIQAGGSIDTKGRPGVMGAVGVSVFGVEAQVREFDQVSDPAFALIGKIRVPIGILVYGLRTRK